MCSWNPKARRTSRPRGRPRTIADAMIRRSRAAGVARQLQPRSRSPRTRSLPSPSGSTRRSPCASATRRAAANGQTAKPPRARRSFARGSTRPYWPFVLVSTSVGQEGLDFHPYCHVVVHWNLPKQPRRPRAARRPRPSLQRPRGPQERGAEARRRRARRRWRRMGNRVRARMPRPARDRLRARPVLGLPASRTARRSSATSSPSRSAASSTDSSASATRSPCIAWRSVKPARRT